MTPNMLFWFLGIAFVLWFIARACETGGVFRDPIRNFRAQSRFDQMLVLALVALWPPLSGPRLA